MSDEPVSGSKDPAPLQFESAEPLEPSAPAGLVCTSCSQPIAREYYESNGKTVCPSCRDKLATAFPGTGGIERFLLASVYGGLAALAGALLWWGVRAATGYEIGLIAVAVGFGVGFGVRAGSQGRGGRRYQILAVFLTYSGVAMSLTPD